ncbi:TPA: LysE family translocator [Salmonella enterica subsp. diarizonae serovar 16:z10:e,n,x,z15]|nr:LysE family translocator [Salmonella enterica subsp. diarizonae serovar 16:z10:e,n,x,z15]
MNVSFFFMYIVSVMLLLLTPGPVIALVTGTAAVHGKRKALKTAFGTNAASLVLIFLASLMVTGLVSIENSYLYILGMLGSVYIGYASSSNLIHANFSASDNVSVVNNKNSGFLKGFFTAISNPKDILFFASFFPQFIYITNNVKLSLAVLSVTWIFLDLSVLFFYILVVSKFISSKYSKLLDIASSFFLLFIAILGFAYNIKELVKI